MSTQRYFRQCACKRFCCKLSLLLQFADSSRQSGRLTFRKDDVKHDVIAFTGDWNGLWVNNIGQIIQIQHLKHTTGCLSCKQICYMTTIIVLRPLHGSTCNSQHFQLRTGGFCWCKVSLPTRSCWWQPAHSDSEDAGVLLNSVIYTVSTPYVFVP